MDSGMFNIQNRLKYFDLDPSAKHLGDVIKMRLSGKPSGKSFDELSDQEKYNYLSDPDLASKIAPFMWSMGEMTPEQKLPHAQALVDEWKNRLPIIAENTSISDNNFQYSTQNTMPDSRPSLNKPALSIETAMTNAIGSIGSADPKLPIYNLFAKLSPTEQKDLLINNPNIITPEGSQIYDPQTNTIRLNESAFTRAQRLDQERLASELSRSLSGNLPTTDNEAVRQATFELGKKQLEPELKSQRQALAIELANRGIPIGSDAYNSEMNRFERQQGEQLNQLSLQSLMAGIQTAEAQRQARFNEISSLLGRTQVGAGTNFGQYQTNYQGLDLMGAQQAALNRASQEGIARAQANAMTTAARWQAAGAAFGGIAGGLGAAFSDISLKTNIKFENKIINNLPIYSFEYKNSKHGVGRFEGVMAQDVEKTYPSAVSVSPEGYKMVDYSKIGVEFKRIN